MNSNPSRSQDEDLPLSQGSVLAESAAAPPPGIGKQKRVQAVVHGRDGPAPKKKKGKQQEEPDEETMKRRPAAAKAKSAKAVPAATTSCTKLDDPIKVPVRVVNRSKPPATYLMGASKTKHSSLWFHWVSSV